MVDSFNALILANRRVTIEDISELMEISMATAHKIVHDDLCFSKVTCCWVPKMLMTEHKALYCSKNSGKHQSFWLGTSATSSLQYRSDAL